MDAGGSKVRILFRKGLCVALSFSTFILTPTPLFASSVDHETSFELSQDMQALYWSKIDQQMPWATEFALGNPLTAAPLPKLGFQSPQIDLDPFFMRSQSWQAGGEDCLDEVCYAKSSSDLIFASKDTNSQLRLQIGMTPIVQTADYIFLSLDDDALFRSKSADAAPIAGLFFIKKIDFAEAAQNQSPLPIFFFPLPGNWTGPNQHSFELDLSEQVVVYDIKQQGIAIELSDVRALERIQRVNLQLGQAWAQLDGAYDGLPKVGTTLDFGLFISGQGPNLKTDFASKLTPKFEKVASFVLPQAAADEVVSNVLSKLRNYISQRINNGASKQKPEAEQNSQTFLQKWGRPLALYGATFGLAAAASGQIDWSAQITSAMPEQIMGVAKILGLVVVGSVALRYTMYKERMDKKYATNKSDSFFERANKEHKALLDVIAPGMYLSVAGSAIAIRHSLEFLKDKIFPGTRFVHDAWAATMGFQMLQSSKLAITWKTFYYGALLFGMADTASLALDLIIFKPWWVHHLGISVTDAGGIAAAFASSQILANLLGHLLAGAHSYSAEVKGIHMQAALSESRQKMIALGLNPQAAKNQSKLRQFLNEEIEKRFKAVGLPGEDEFLFDPNTVIEWLAKKSGYSADELSGITSEQKAQLAKTDFVLKQGRWGLVVPALKAAVQAAIQIQKVSPSETGAKTVELLQWASDNRSLLEPVAERTWDVAASDWAQAEMLQSIRDEQNQADRSKVNSKKQIESLAEGVKGAFKYLASDATKEARDIRLTLFLMSTTGSSNDMLEFLPQSWREKAGSDLVAQLAAEIFNRAFFRYYESQPDLLPDLSKKPAAWRQSLSAVKVGTAQYFAQAETSVPETIWDVAGSAWAVKGLKESIDRAYASDLESAYGARAMKLVNRLASQQGALNDPFAREVRYRDFMYRLKLKDQARAEILNYKPARMSNFAKKQWAIARLEAAKTLKAIDPDEQVFDEWKGLAELYSEVIGKPMADIAKFTKSYHYRSIVAQKFAEQVGLQIENLENSGFVKAATLTAINETEKQLSNAREQSYLMKLSDEDERSFYQAQIFSRHFITAYIDKSVKDFDQLKGSSPEFPGRLQFIRRALVGVRGSSTVSYAIRVFESFFRNEEDVYAPGRLAQLSRSIPILPDVARTFVQNLRILPYMLSFSWFTSYYLWQIKTPWPLWAAMSSLGFISYAAATLNNRLQRFTDNKPMNDPGSKLVYAWWHSRWTNPTLVFVQMNAESISAAVSGGIAAAEAKASDCAEALLGKKH
jgi:hypothetical protein